ncbi:MAG: hypothetical protein ACYDCO_14380 [Armatimonadota bacterium]
MPLADLIRDNPILIRHMRARLRWQQVVTALVIVLVLSGCLTLLGLLSLLTNDPNSDETWYSAVILTVVLQGLVLFLVGGSQVGNAVGSARESGMMDFHRISPQSPSALALGFLIGAPIREYMMFACTLPGYALLVTAIPQSLLVSGDLQVDQLWLLPLVMLVLALLYHTIGIVGGLSVSGAQRRNAGVLVILVVIIVTTLGLFPPMAYLSFLAPLWLALNDDLSNIPIQFTFFGAHLPIVFLSLLHQGTLFAFCWLAAVQKIRQENTPPFTRPVALLFFAVIGFLCLGDVIIRRDAWSGTAHADETSMTVLLYSLTILALVLLASITPQESQFVRGIRQARKIGLLRVPRWSNAAANWPPVLAFAGILLVFALVGMAICHLITITPGFNAGAALAAIVIAVGTVLHFGFLHQYFLLKFRKQGNNYLALTLFLGWLLPIIFGLLLAALQADEVVWEATMSFSPLAGLGLVFHPDHGALCSVIAIPVTVLWTVIALGLMSPTVAHLTRGVWIASRPEPAPVPAER